MITALVILNWLVFVWSVRASKTLIETGQFSFGWLLNDVLNAGFCVAITMMAVAA